jgi:hypothetical protein
MGGEGHTVNDGSEQLLPYPPIQNEIKRRQEKGDADPDPVSIVEGFRQGSRVNCHSQGHQHACSEKRLETETQPAGHGERAGDEWDWVSSDADSLRNTTCGGEKFDERSHRTFSEE